MIVHPGEYVKITITTDTGDAPPVNLRWRPPAGVTNLTVSLVTETDGTHTGNFTINSVETK